MTAPPGPTKPHYTLVVETVHSGSAPGERRPPPARYPVVARETILGRDPACAIRLDDDFVSREHARLLLRDLDLHLEDLGSTNETRLDGVLVETRVRVRPGNSLCFGRAVCRIECGPRLPEAEPVEPEEAPAPRTLRPGLVLGLLALAAALIVAALIVAGVLWSWWR